MDEILADKIQFASKKWLPRLPLAIATILMVPTVAIMASWNSLPGDRLYPTKRYLEGVALKLVGNNFTARADLQSQYVEHRFNEAETLLTVSSSTAGLDDLVQQIHSAKTDIIAAKERVGSKDQEQAEQESQKLVAQLKEYNQKLEDSKQEIRANSSADPKKTATRAPSPSVAPSTRIQASAIPTPSVSPVIAIPSQSSSSDQVDIVQQEIAKVVEELEHKGAKNDDKKDERGAKDNRNESDNKNDNDKKDKSDDKEKQRDKKD